MYFVIHQQKAPCPKVVFGVKYFLFEQIVLKDTMANVPYLRKTYTPACICNWRSVICRIHMYISWYTYIACAQHTQPSLPPMHIFTLAWRFMLCFINCLWTSKYSETKTQNRGFFLLTRLSVSKLFIDLNSDLPRYIVLKLFFHRSPPTKFNSDFNHNRTSLSCFLRQFVRGTKRVSRSRDISVKIVPRVYSIIILSENIESINCCATTSWPPHSHLYIYRGIVAYIIIIIITTAALLTSLLVRFTGVVENE